MSGPKVLTDIEVKVIQEYFHFGGTQRCQRSGHLVQRGPLMCCLLGILQYKSYHHPNSQSHINNQQKRRRNHMIVIFPWYLYREADWDDRMSMRCWWRRQTEAHYRVTPALPPVSLPAQNGVLKLLKQPIACP